MQPINFLTYIWAMPATADHGVSIQETGVIIRIIEHDNLNFSVGCLWDLGK